MNNTRDTQDTRATPIRWKQPHGIIMVKENLYWALSKKSSQEKLQTTSLGDASIAWLSLQWHTLFQVSYTSRMEYTNVRETSRSKIVSLLVINFSTFDLVLILTCNHGMTSVDILSCAKCDDKDHWPSVTTSYIKTYVSWLRWPDDMPLSQCPIDMVIFHQSISIYEAISIGCFRHSLSHFLAVSLPSTKSLA